MEIQIGRWGEILMSPSYYCTWCVQNYMYGIGKKSVDSKELEGSRGSAHARKCMNLQTAFGEDGWAARFHPEARKDLYFMIDDGWDVPYNVNPDWFGSLIPDPKRFPLNAEEPWQRYQMLNRLAKQAGWRGLGIWVAAQEAPALWNGKAHTPADQTVYWKERMAWSERAGVEYWKMDWGAHAADIQFRINITQWARQYAPHLTIGHAVCQAPVNDDRLENRPGADWNGFKNPIILRSEAAFLRKLIFSLLLYPVFVDQCIMADMSRRSPSATPPMCQGYWQHGKQLASVPPRP